ncbi:MAG TPA: hypothetical protein DCO78_14955 [Chitinophagaceae bacterium]|nr:hypothetical protein [Chitinophagaceae bacterium]
MNEHLFDQYFRTKLQDHQAEVPADMWSRIIQEKPKRRPFLFWLNTKLSILLTACLLTSSLGYLFYPNIQSLIGTPEALDTKEITSIESLSKSTDKVALNTEQSSTQESPVFSTPIAQTNTAEKNLQQKFDRINLTKQASSIAKRNNNLQAFSTVTEPRRYDTPTTVANNLMLQEESTDQFSTADLWRFNGRKNLRTPFQLSSVNGIGKPIDCPPTGRARIRNDWYAEVYFSPEYTTKTINGGSLPANYLNRKDSSESMRGGFTAGIGLSANIGEHLLIRTGIQYAQINERFAMRLENERRTITVVTTRPLVRAPGDTIYVSDTSTMQQIGYLTRKTQNRYRSIEIPLILGYEWGNEQVKFSINAGIIATATSWYSGEILDTTNQIVALSSKGQSSIYQQQIGLSGFGSIRISKPIRPGLEIYAEPFFRTNFSSMQIRQPAFTQRFSSTGIQLGVKWKLN